MTTIGGLNLPAQTNLDAVTDPILSYLPPFLERAIGRYLDAAWSRVSTDPIIRNVFAHDPEVCDVASKDFPALFVWRAAGGPTERNNEDRAEFRARVNVLWVFSVERQLRLVRQLPVFNGLEKTLYIALENGRVSTWRVPGDTDPQAPKRGSLVWKYAGGEFKGLLSSNPDAGVTVEMINGGKLESFPAILFAVDILERATRVPEPGEYAPHRNTTTLTQPRPDDDVRLIAIDEPPTP